ncbi:DUF262 domain-containing HNH endonuclease family protein [Vibrio rhizosphaerae]|uniref:DUF262 domain-containing HNH endonuclease family protein n=1 Tax=Vibrio rhizosphaerae TaxID=398736 RepID=A0ABU4ITU9_9VIBR|nr:DUF262 domain-containing HNH endonuclease family protein [Vibrio rhizosphaerae]MDW6092166.1 DUF262 domain-containing HNH endonuclease family protein [Vibrio rhizosphaerae]
MASQLDKVFSADPKSVFELFLSKGTAGFYIPAYQRHYSWDDSNIQRLIEDMCNGISTFFVHDDAITFIGTVISISDTEHKTIKPFVIGELPSEVMSIIDGQQRVTTLSLLATCLYQEMSSLYLKFNKLEQVEEQWFLNAYNPILNKLKHIFEVDKYSTDPKYRFYPKIARAYLDQWATSETNAFYNSPIASYLYGFITYIHSFVDGYPSKKYVHKISDNLAEEQKPKHKRVIDNVNSINNHLKKILDGDDSYSFPDLMEFSSDIEAQRRLIGNIMPSSVTEKLKLEIRDGSQKVSIERSIRLLILSNFYLDRVAVTSVVATNETYAFDMFEALNTTGEPLTAFETFKPKVVDFEGVELYETSESREYIDIIDDILDKYKKAEDKQKATSRLLIPFRLIREGEALSKHLSEQRRFINRAFDDLGSDSRKRMFTRELSLLAQFMDQVWPEKSSVKPELAYNSKRKNEVLLCLNVLRDSNHHITIALIFRFYSFMVLNRYSEDSTFKFEEAIFAITAFFTIWRGSRNGTQGIDACYREIMKNGVHGILPPLSSQHTEDIADINIESFKKALFSFISGNKKFQILNRDDWIKRASKVSCYSNSKPLARFMLLLSSHQTVANNREYGLVEPAVNGVNNLLSPKYWEMYSTLEHIYPQSSGDGWDDTLKNIHSEHVIGNLVILPAEVNSSLGNSSWKTKKLIYKIISSRTDSERQNVINEAKELKLELPDSTKYLALTREHMPQLEAISNVFSWDVSVIEKRSNNLLGIIWDRLAPWLDLN